MPITRINLKDKPTPAYDLYMGRENKWWNLPQSKWANPFHLKKEADRPHILELYRNYILGSPELIAALPELKGKTLACWCPKHKACHCDVLIEFYRQHVGDPEE